MGDGLTNLVVDASWVAGLLFAMIRMTAFAVASPIFARAIPMVGRMALVLVLSFYFAAPVPGSLDIVVMLRGVAANLVVGIALGFLTGLIFHLFSIAGSLIDFTSSLSAASVFDPMSGTQAAVFSRAFNMTALALFFVLGGDRLVVLGMAASIEAVSLTGGIEISAALGETALRLLGRMMVAAIELAMPALAALFVAEVVLGIAARFAPQANVFLIGLPVKVLAALASVTIVVLLVPETFTGMLGIFEDTFVDVLAGFRGT